MEGTALIFFGVLYDEKTISLILILNLLLSVFSCTRSTIDEEVAAIERIESSQQTTDVSQAETEQKTETQTADKVPETDNTVSQTPSAENKTEQTADTQNIGIEVNSDPPTQTATPAPADDTEPENTDDTEISDPYALEPEFEKYRSNTTVTTGNHYMLTSETEVTETYRGVFPVQQHGRLEYCFYFSNCMDSTYAGGDIAYRNMPTESYEIVSAAVMVSKALEPTTVARRTRITFSGEASRTVEPDEMFWSDPVMFTVSEGEYLVFEWKVRYTAIPCNLVNYVGAGYLVNANNTLDKQMNGIPLPSMIGAKRETELNIAFIGDSITAGEGAGLFNGYVSQITEQLGDTASVWNIALGYARANDAVNSPAWVKKARSADTVAICFGVNDINSGVYSLGVRTADQIVDDIAFVAKEVKDAGGNVVIISTPPYTYADDARVQKWKEVVSGLKALAKDNKYSFFDLTYLLGDQNSAPLYGGHPNAEGCTVVANAFIKAYKEGSVILK